MIKKLPTYRINFLLKALFCFSLFLALGTTDAIAQFAITEDFRGNGNPDIIIGGPGGTEGTATLTSGITDPVNAGWLRLTNSNTYQKGFAYVNKSFPSTMGVLVDFEYKMWRDVNDGNNGADGIGVFLFDANSTFKLGGYGGSLGYAPNGAVTGLTGGYVGVGLDAYGNYSNESEGRVGGPGERPNAVVLRGPTTTNATTNRFLTGKTVRTSDGINFTYTDINGPVGLRNENALDWNTQTSTRPTDAQFYRRVQVEITRLDAAGIYYNVLVRWKTTPTGPFVYVTDYTTTDIPPGLFKLGFAASSGASRNYHEIRNLLVTTPGNLRIVKRADKDMLRLNNATNKQITYTIEVTNDTAFEIPAIAFTDRITDSYGNLIPEGSAGFDITAISTSGFVTAAMPTVTTLTTTEITGNLVLAANSTGTITITGTLNMLPDGGVLQNTATAKPPLDEDLNNNTSTVRTPVTAENVDLILTKTVSQQCIDSSTPSIFTVYVSNNGTEGASFRRLGYGGPRIGFSIVVPPGYLYQDVTDGGLIGSASDNADSNTLSKWSRMEMLNTPSTGYTTYVYVARGTDAGGAAQTLGAGMTYNYPVKYTMQPSSGTTVYTDTSSAKLFVDYDYTASTEPLENRANNDASIEMYVKPAAPAVPAGTIYYCIDEASSVLQATATGTNTLRWYTTLNGFSSEFPIKPNTNWAGTYTYYVSQVNVDCESAKTPITVVVGPTDPGTITPNSYFVCPGTSTTITGSPITGATYRWQSASNINGPWNNISGTNRDRSSGNLTTSTYFRRMTTVTINGSKQCEGPTNVILVSVNSAGTIGDPQAFCQNQGNASSLYSVVAPVGNVTSYQWQRSDDESDWDNINNANNETYNPPNADETWYYRRAVSFSGCTVYSNPIRVSISASAPSAGSISGPTSVCAGNAVTFSSTGAGGGSTTSYIWQSSPNGNNNSWTTISGATGLNYTTDPLTTTTHFRRVAVNNCGSTATTAIQVAVNTVLPGSLGTTKTICYNTSPGQLGGTTGGASNGSGAGTITYRWEAATGSSGGTFSAVGGTASTYTPGTLTSTMRYRRYAKSSTNGCEVYVELLVIVKTLTNQGTISGDQSVCNGASASPIIGTTASSEDAITYEWRRATTSAGATTAISGTNTQNYTPTSTGYYLRRTKTICGDYDTARVYVYFMPVINPGTITAPNPATVCSGSIPGQINGSAAAALSPAPATTTTFSYRWESSTSLGGPYTTAPGTSNLQNYTAPVGLTQTTYYRRIVIATVNGNSCESAASTPITITVPQTLPGTIGANQTICHNTQPALLTTVSGQPATGQGMITYRWQYSDVYNSNWNNVATTESYQPGNLSVTTYYKRFAISSGCESAESNIITITVAPEPSGNFQTGNIPTSPFYVCNGEANPTIASQSPGVVPSPGVVGYQWQIYNGSDWVDILNATSASYTPPGTASVTTRYRRLVTGTYNGITCRRSNYGPETEIKVLLVATGGQINNDQTVCNGNTPAELTNVTNGANANGGYQWQVSTDNAIFNDILNANNPNYQPGSITQTTYYRRLGRSNDGGKYCTGTSPSNVVTMTVPGVPTPGSIGSNQNICGNSQPALLTSVTPGVGGTGYQWQESYNNSSWSNLSGATSDTYQPPALASSRYYRRLTINNGCPSSGTPSVFINVVANPTPGTITAPTSVCAGSTPGPITGDSGWPANGTPSYRWYSSTDNVNWTNTGVTTQNYSFSGAVASTTYFRRALLTTSCAGEVFSNTATITPIAAPTPGTITGTQTICMDTAPTILASAPGGDGTGSGTLTYRWEYSLNGSTGWTIIAGASGTTYQPLKLHATRHYRRTTLSSTGCQSSVSNTVVVTTKNCKIITNPMVRSRVN